MSVSPCNRKCLYLKCALFSMHQTLNISQGFLPECICMTIFTHRHSAPYGDQEVSPSVKLDRHFHKLVWLYAVLTAPTCIFPDCGTPRRARRCEGPFNAACSFNFVLFSVQCFFCLFIFLSTLSVWKTSSACLRLISKLSLRIQSMIHPPKASTLLSVF